MKSDGVGCLTEIHLIRSLSRAYRTWIIHHIRNSSCKKFEEKTRRPFDKVISQMNSGYANGDSTRKNEFPSGSMLAFCSKEEFFKLVVYTTVINKSHMNMYVNLCLFLLYYLNLLSLSNRMIAPKLIPSWLSSLMLKASRSDNIHSHLWFPN